jgi:hypothetical protein
MEEVPHFLSGGTNSNIGGVEAPTDVQVKLLAFGYETVANAEVL